MVAFFLKKLTFIYLNEAKFVVKMCVCFLDNMGLLNGMYDKFVQA